MTEYDAYVLLLHARWHCLFGSGHQDREDTDDSDKAAAKLLGKLADDIMAEALRQ